MAFSLPEAICRMASWPILCHFRFMIREPDLPADALSARYRSEDGHYTDCFATDVQGEVSLAEFVEAFYTARLFRCERVILKYFAKRPSTDAEARAVAQGTAKSFAAWTVEDRTDTQLLMCDMHEATRSWFKVEPAGGSTRLFFGSAVVSFPVR